MTADDVCDGLADSGHQSWVLEYANWGVGSSLNFLELMMAVKVNFPADLLELLDESCFNKVNRAFINA